MFESLRSRYRATLKSSDTEEHIDLFVYRPIGFVIALICKRLYITPNIVTIASMFIGVAAGLCMYPAEIWINITGLLLLAIANALDSADGQLARMTGQYSRMGRILDGLAGDFWFLTIYIVIALRTVRDVTFFDHHAWVIWAIASCAGLCHLLQAAMADYLRQFHLLFVKRSFPTEFDNSYTQRCRYSSIPRTKPFARLTAYLYYLYTRVQEAMSPAMLRLYEKVYTGNLGGTISDMEIERVRVVTFPLCKWENFLTFNWRFITLVAAVVTGYPFIYFIVELTLFNVVFAYLISKHERVCRSML